MTEKKPNPYKVQLVLGGTANFDCIPYESKVVGVDDYFLRSVSDLEKSWKSYTLVCKDAPSDSPYERWWAVNLDLGTHFFTAAKGERPAEQDMHMDADLSGLVSFTSQGDASVSGGTDLTSGALLIHHMNDGNLYAEEVLPGCDRIAMIGVPYNGLDLD